MFLVRVIDKLSLSQRAFLLIALPLFFEFIFVGALLYLLHESDSVRQQEREANQIMAQLNIVVRTIGDQSLALAALKYTGLPIYDERRIELLSHFPSEIVKLQNMLERTRKQVYHTEHLTQLCAQTVKAFERVRSTIEDPHVMPERFAEIREELSPLLSELNEELSPIQRRESRIEIEQPILMDKLKHWIDLLSIVGLCGSVLCAGLLTLSFNKSTVSKLAVLTENVQRYRHQLPLHAPLSGGDEFTRLDQVFHQVVDELKEAYRRETAIVENVQEVICSVSGLGCLLAVNAAGIQLLGYSKEELLQKSILDLVADQDRARASAILQTVISEGKAEKFECRVISSTQRTLEMLWSVTWSSTESALFCVAHDISQRKEMERVKQQFISLISHDLRTPLTTIQSTFSLLSDGILGPLNDRQRARIIAAESDSDRLLDLINDLLDSERMESGALQLDCAPCRLSSIIQRSIFAVLSLADQANVTIEWSPDNHEIMADESRLIQVLVNLLSNAVKFSAPGSSIKVGVISEQNALKISVSDQGPGIPESHRQIIFERFQQVPGADFKRGKGTGLGLFIARNIVEAHRGKIGVTSNESGGSNFWFTIPLEG